MKIDLPRHSPLVVVALVLLALALAGLVALNRPATTDKPTPIPLSALKSTREPPATAPSYDKGSGRPPGRDEAHGHGH